MSTTELETPFLASPSYSTEVQESPLVPESVIVSPWISEETPFLRDAYETAGARDAEVQALGEVLLELRDEAFEQIVYEAAARAADALGDRLTGEYGEVAAQSEQAEHELEQHFAPVVAEAEAMYERMEAALSRQDLTALPQPELERLLDQLAPEPGRLGPEQEQFLGAIFRKAKAAVQGAVSLAKRGVGALAKLGLTPLIAKLKALVGPLVRRVIQFAMNKLPPGVRPIAQKLARRFLGSVAGEVEAQAEGANTVQAEAIQQEYDLRVAELLLSTELDREEEARLDEAEEEATDPAAALAVAKEKLVDQLTAMPSGQDPAPALEQFIPAAIMAVRPIVGAAVRIIGRPRVVKLIAGLMAKLIQRWIGPEEARALATPLASAALSLVASEAAADPEPRRAAAEVLGETLEQTVLEVAQLSEATLENDVMLEAAVRDAFEAAAAAYFPDPVLVPQLRETAAAPGVWVALPRERRRKYYRKYSRVFDVQVMPQIAASVKTFGGVTLADFLQGVLLVNTSRPVKARMHLYELTIGSRLSEISAREKVPGLGSRSWSSWVQLHPLTPEAATALLSEPGLARPVGAEFLQGPYLTAIGQRFYFLQIPGVVVPRPKRVEPPKNTVEPPKDTKPPLPVCVDRVSVTVDLGGARVVVRLQFAEKTAQAISAALKRKDIAGAFRIMKTLEAALRQAVSTRQAGFTLKGFEVAEYLGGPETEEEGALAAIGGKLLEKLLDKLVDLLWEGLANYVKNTAQEFVRAAEDPADGVVVYVAYVNVPGLAQIRNLRQGVKGLLSGSLGALLPSLNLTIPRPSISVHAGCSR